MTNEEKLAAAVEIDALLTDLKISGDDVVGTNDRGQLVVLPGHVLEARHTADAAVKPEKAPKPK